MRGLSRLGACLQVSLPAIHGCAVHNAACHQISGSPHGVGQVADFGLSRVLTAEAISTGTYGAPPAVCLCIIAASHVGGMGMIICCGSQHAYPV